MFTHSTRISGVGRGKRKRPGRNDLRNAVSLVRANRTPDDAWGFDNHVTPYWNGWATWEAGQGLAREAGAEEDITDLFVIRTHPGLDVREQDFLVWEGRYYKVQSAQYLDQVRDFGILYCTQYQDVAQLQAEVVGSETGQPVGGPSTPFWPPEPS